MRRPTSTMSARSEDSVRHAVRALYALGAVLIAAGGRAEVDTCARPSTSDTARSGTTNVPHTGSRTICTLRRRHRLRLPVRPARSALRSMPSTIARTLAPTMRTARGAGQTGASRIRALASPGAGVRRAQAVERALGGLPFRAVRRDRDDLLPGLRRAVEILLAERPHDADVQQRLGMLGIELQRAGRTARAPCPAGSCSSSRRRGRC